MKTISLHFFIRIFQQVLEVKSQDDARKLLADLNNFMEGTKGGRGRGGLRADVGVLEFE